MAFVAITTAETEAGKPTKQELFVKIKDNFDDHEVRIASLETGIGVFRPVQFYVQGDFFRLGTVTDFMNDRINFDTTLTSGKLTILDAQASGTLTVDILFKRGASPFASIFSVKPTLSGANAAFTVNSGTLGTTALLTDDILRLDLTTNTPVGVTKFLLELEYSV